jgi:ERF superfamily
MTKSFMSEDITKIAPALARFQSQICPVPKDTQGYGYKYADLATIWEAIRGQMGANDLTITQVFEIEGELVTLRTMLIHTSGQWISSCICMDIRQKIQDVGKAITYLRRYSLSAILGITAEEDDDGKSANDLGAPPAKPKPPVPVKKPEEGKKAPMPRIDGKQYETLLDYLDRIDEPTYLPKFLAHMKVAEVAEILREDFQKAEHALSKKLERKMEGQDGSNVA